MAKIAFSMFILSLTIIGFFGTAESRSRGRVYIEAICRATPYFDTCVETLLPYAKKNKLPSRQKLAQISLTTCLAETRNLKAYVDTVANQLTKTKTPGGYALEDCLQQINNGVNKIAQSVKELQQMGKDGVELQKMGKDGEKFSWYESKVQTWVSTDATTTCIDRVSGDKIGRTTKSTFRARFLNLSQLANNSIALFKNP